MCQKEDISVQFWLIAGFTIMIVGVTAFAIGLLYSVGEETLPGVIGAGVSRSK
jgi:1,4-dihydroxy-2-naphthoate octaprenyltransferase